MSTLRMLATGLAAVAALTIADRASAQTAPTSEELKRKVERVAPQYPTHPGKVMCACPHTGFASRAVGYLHSVINDHGNGRATVDVYCLYWTYSVYDGTPQYTQFCANYELLK